MISHSWHKFFVLRVRSWIKLSEGSRLIFVGPHLHQLRSHDQTLALGELNQPTSKIKIKEKRTEATVTTLFPTEIIHLRFRLQKQKSRVS